MWLARTKNDQPCMISYPYGKGRVVLSTLYMDWAAGNHQGTAHERLFFRDLTAFLLSDAPVLRADSGRITVDVPAPDDGEGRGVFTPLLIGPDGEEIALPEGVAAGVAVNLPQGSAPGFYRLGGVFTYPSGKIAGRVLPGIRFALSALPESLSAGGGVGGGISASAASDLENYIRGAEAKFSILLWNRGSEAKRVRVDWRFPPQYPGSGGGQGQVPGFLHRRRGAGGQGDPARNDNGSEYGRHRPPVGERLRRRHGRAACGILERLLHQKPVDGG
ncbi:MAG: hypothetical protein ACOX5A_05625 [Aminivibrio sp.]